MKLTTLTIAALSVLDKTQASSWLRKAAPERVGGDSLDEDAPWFNRLIQDIDSLATQEPTPQPISSSPTQAGVTSAPTTGVTPAPTPMPVSTFPTQATVTSAPTTEVTPSPTPGATPLPTRVPTLVPTPEPTGACASEVTIDCSTFLNNSPIGCEDLPPIDMPYCVCDECARTLVFQYTGNGCNGLDGCVDGAEAGPGENATISFSPCGSDVPALEISTFPGDTILIELGDSCLPECMDVVVVATDDSTSNQTFQLDTTCITRELLLKESYGSLDFAGYSCNATGINTCLQEVVYTVEACNEGSENLTVYDLAFNFNGEVSDLLEGAEPVVLPGECINATIAEVVDRCLDSDYSVSALMNATEPVFGPVCEATDEFGFIVEAGTLEPTPSPSLVPTGVAPPPTDSCGLVVAVEAECPIIECGWDRCKDRPFRMEFRFSATECDNTLLKRCPGVDPDSCTCIRNVTLTEEDWPSQQLSCTDFGAVNASETYYVKAFPERDPSVIYFEGEMAPGGRFNATDPNLERVESNMFLEVYSSLNGDLLQQILFHSSCSQELYLLDIFGSFQLVEFETLDKVTTFAINPQLSFALTLAIESDLLELDFVGVGVFSPDPFILAPQTETFNVTGVSIPPPYSESTDIILIPDEDFTVITTVSGVVNGVPCTEITDVVVNCPATVEPELSR
jgi:hypothetical protein